MRLLLVKCRSARKKTRRNRRAQGRRVHKSPLQKQRALRVSKGAVLELPLPVAPLVAVVATLAVAVPLPAPMPLLPAGAPQIGAIAVPLAPTLSPAAGLRLRILKKHARTKSSTRKESQWKSS